jgi:transcriptional regulator GlxA family with amidase domain
MTNSSFHPAIKLAQQYIDSKLATKITMADLRAFTRYSERSLQLLFKNQFNKTPFEYIEEQRLLRAYELIKLHKQNKKTTQIALDVGCRHLGRFSVKFKARFGIHPSVLSKTG